MMQSLLSIINWIRRREIVVLLAVLAVVLGTWAFIKLADAVKEKDTQSFDERIILKMRRPENRALPIRPPWLAEVGRDITALGGVAVLWGLTLVGGGFSAGWVGGVVGGTGLGVDWLAGGGGA